MTTIRGTTPEVVRTAIADRDSFPGTRGFAGAVDGRLVRDVLGRQPLFVDATAQCSSGPPPWAFTPTELDTPQLFPAGHVGTTDPESLWSLPTAPSSSISTLTHAITAALDDIEDTIPVAFSGGIDSGAIAAAGSGPLFAAGFPDSPDLVAATAGADALKRSLHTVELDHERLQQAVVTVATATGRTNPMDVTIAVPLYLTAVAVKEAGYDRLALGQGADELFGGYAKVAKAPSDPRVDATTVRAARDEVLQTLPAQLPRDILAVRAAGVDPVLPLLDDRVVVAGLGLPESALVSESQRKVGLRKAVADWVPESIRRRDKKAVQYGTYVSRELDRLARQAGFKRRMDNHVGKYISSLLTEADDY